MRNYSKIVRVGREYTRSVGPSFDPYHQARRDVRVGEDWWTYYWCALGGEYAVPRSLSKVKAEDLAAFGAPSHEEVERWAGRHEAKAFRREVAAYRAEGYKRKKAQRLVANDHYMMAEMEAEIYSNI